MLASYGLLVYSENPHKLIVKVDDEIGRYYRSLIPKYYRVQQPLYDSHISVIRNEKIVNLDFWKKYHLLNIYFEYDNYINNYGVYFWLNSKSDILTNIRMELGLSKTSEWSRPPDNSNNFHITIGNSKHLKKY